MTHLSALVGAAARAGAGTITAWVLGWFLFHGRMFAPERMEFQVITIGLLTAWIVSLVRAQRVGWGAMSVVAFTVYQWASYSPIDTKRAIVQTVAAFFVATGLLLAGIVFDRLGKMGLPVGKFLILGPMVGIMMLAVTPLATLVNVGVPDIPRLLIENLFLGMVIGNGVGIGIELVEQVAFRGMISGEDPDESKA